MIISILRYIAVQFLYLIIIIIGLLFFPVFYFSRCRLGKDFIFFDSSENSIYGDDNWIKEKGLKKNLWTAWRWAFRNPSWNFHIYIKPKEGTKHLIRSKGSLTKNGKKPNIYEFAVIKTLNERGEYAGNYGKYFSIIHSIIGKILVWYKIGKTTYFRFSKVWKWSLFWFELMIGTNDVRYLFRFKIKILK